MTPIDEAPEQRWRRTVDRRNRPAKLKVDRLLRDFGYAELDPAVGDAIEARLAGVALAVAPSLRNAATNEVVTIYANDAAVAEEAGPPPAAGDTDPLPVAEPPGISDVAQMVTYLKQQVLDARAEGERLRTELDRRIAARTDAESEAQSIIAEQAAALEAQAHQIAQLGAALDQTRQALADTRDEIRRAVGELQALPEPPRLAGDDLLPADDEPADEDSLSGEESGDGREEAEATWAASTSPPAPEGEPPAPEAEPPAPEAEPPAPVVRELAVVPDEPALDPEEPAPALGEEPPAPALGEPARDAELATFDLDEPPLGEEPPADAAAELDDLAEWQPGAAAQLDEPVDAAPPLRAVDDDLGELDAAPPAAAAEPAAADPETAGTSSADTGLADVHVHPAQHLRANGEPAASGGDASEEVDEDLLTGMDDFLYDADELYDPVAGGDAYEALQDDALEAPRADALERPRDDAPAALDEGLTTLPPPPPAPPSPWADEPILVVPVVHERATIGKVLRGRGGRGRGRGRWQGSCSICGREPGDSRRKDLEAAGWDLDETAAACRSVAASAMGLAHSGVPGHCPATR